MRLLGAIEGGEGRRRATGTSAGARARGWAAASHCRYAVLEGRTPALITHCPPDPPTHTAVQPALQNLQGAPAGASPARRRRAAPLLPAVRTLPAGRGIRRQQAVRACVLLAMPRWLPAVHSRTFDADASGLGPQLVAAQSHVPLRTLPPRSNCRARLQQHNSRRRKATQPGADLTRSQTAPAGAMAAAAESLAQLPHLLPWLLLPTQGAVPLPPPLVPLPPLFSGPAGGGVPVLADGLPLPLLFAAPLPAAEGNQQPARSPSPPPPSQGSPGPTAAYSCPGVHAGSPEPEDSAATESVGAPPEAAAQSEPPHAGELEKGWGSLGSVMGCLPTAAWCYPCSARGACPMRPTPPVTASSHQQVASVAGRPCGATARRGQSRPMVACHRRAGSRCQRQERRSHRRSPPQPPPASRRCS